MRFNSKKYIMIPTIFSRITQIHLPFVKQAGVQSFGFCFHRQASGRGKDRSLSSFIVFYRQYYTMTIDETQCYNF